MEQRKCKQRQRHDPSAWGAGRAPHHHTQLAAGAAQGRVLTLGWVAASRPPSFCTGAALLVSVTAALR